MLGSNNNQDNAGEGKARMAKYASENIYGSLLNFRDIITVALVIKTVYVFFL